MSSRSWQNPVRRNVSIRMLVGWLTLFSFNTSLSPNEPKTQVQTHIFSPFTYPLRQCRHRPRITVTMPTIGGRCCRFKSRKMYKTGFPSVIISNRDNGKSSPKISPNGPLIVNINNTMIRPKWLFTSRCGVAIAVGRYCLARGSYGEVVKSQLKETPFTPKVIPIMQQCFHENAITSVFHFRNE